MEFQEHLKNLYTRELVVYECEIAILLNFKNFPQTTTENIKSIISRSNQLSYFLREKVQRLLIQRGHVLLRLGYCNAALISAEVGMQISAYLYDKKALQWASDIYRENKKPYLAQDCVNRISRT